MYNLEQIVNEIYFTPSDINEHIPTLVEYGSKCDHITEMGVRGIKSTWALLGSGPKKMISYDLRNPSEYGGDINMVYNVAKQYGIDFTFREADVLKIDIEETDLLFLDTWHAYKQLKSELLKHVNKVKKYIIMHDTTSYEFNDEQAYEIIDNVLNTPELSQGKGLIQAINEFLQINNNWILHKRYTNNNGLTILKRNE